MKTFGRFLLVLCLAGWHASVFAAVTASVDRSVLTVDDSLTLTLSATAGEDIDAADLGALARDFTVAGTSRSTRYSIVNGQSESSSELMITLYPRRSGDLQIPSLDVDGSRTRPLAIRVEENPTDLDSNVDVFVETEVDSKNVYVQAQILHTFRIYQAVTLDDRGRSQLEIPDAIVEELEPVTFQRNVNGRTYLVTEIRHAIFPQKSGELTIPSITFSGRERSSRRSFLSLGNSGDLLRRRGEEINIKVKPIPAAFPDAQWLPARSLALEDNWSLEPDKLAIGASTTRTVTLTAEGVNGSQLPRLSPPPVDGIRVYPDQPRSENIKSESGLTGLGINSAALLVTAPGDYTLPAVRIPWWDTRTDKLRFAEIPERRFSVVATSVPAQPTAATGSGDGDIAARQSALPATASVWFWSTLAALLGWMLTVLWLWRRQGAARRPDNAADRSPDSRESKLFKEVIACCRKNRASDSRAALQRWGRQAFHCAAPPGMNELGRWIEDDTIAAQLSELESALYSDSSGEWSGAQLADALQSWRKQAHRRDGDRAASALPPLYQ
jgi:hypothetical protein